MQPDYHAEIRSIARQAWLLCKAYQPNFSNFHPKYTLAYIAAQLAQNQAFHSARQAPETARLIMTGLISLLADANYIFHNNEPVGKLFTLHNLLASQQNNNASMRGIVADAATGKPIANATVSIAGSITKTSITGRYLLTNLQAGIFNMTIRADGYAGVVLGSIEIKTGAAYRINIDLEHTATHQPVKASLNC